MSTTPQDVAAIRARVADHEAAKGAAEARRAEMIAGRQNALVNLTDLEMEDFDAELARIVRSVERADAHLGLLRPALTAAEAREAAAEARRLETSQRAALAAIATAGAELFIADPVRAAAIANAARIAMRPPVQYSPALFEEPPPPRVTSGDTEGWWRDREARLRAEGKPAETLRR